MAGRRRDIIGVLDTTGSGFAYSAITVTATATAIPTSPMGNRKAITIRNFDAAAKVYLGDSSVTSSTGFPLLPYESLPFDLSSGAALYAICASGESAEVRVLEVNND